MTEITETEWLAEIDRLIREEKSSDEGFTSAEWQAKLKVNENKVKKILKHLVLSGRMQVGKRFVHHDWDGKSRHYTVYSPTK